MLQVRIAVSTQVCLLASQALTFKILLLSKAEKQGHREVRSAATSRFS